MDKQMHTNWDDMRYLLALQREGSALAAARFLHVSHQTVSRKLNSLENSLGASLLDRSGTTWRLTVAGESIAHRAAAMEKEVQTAICLARTEASGMKGRVRITTAEIGFEHFVMPGLKKLMKLYPEIEFEIVLDRAPKDIQTGRFDIAVRFTKAPPEHLIGTNAGPIKFKFYGAATQINALDEAGLASLPFSGPLIVLGNHNLDTAGWIGSHIHRDSLTLKVSDISALASAIQNGLGSGYMPELLLPPNSDLAESRYMPARTPFDVWILRHQDSRQSEKIGIISKVLQASIADILGTR